MQYNLEWDSKKAKSNFQKYKISFGRASGKFLDPILLSVFDKKHSEAEDRWVTIGKDRNNVTVVVVHTLEGVHSDIPFPGILSEGEREIMVGLRFFAKKVDEEVIRLYWVLRAG